MPGIQGKVILTVELVYPLLRLGVGGEETNRKMGRRNLYPPRAGLED